MLIKRFLGRAIKLSSDAASEINHSGEESKHYCDNGHVERELGQ